ncbi:MAG: penicillin-insensitive murein endopeptidase, partial [Labilithrix sp.]|nr:penicillin-insensitive murein endopeptidase [Labilithrix sp.]
MPRFTFRLVALAALLVAPAAVAGPPAKKPAQHGGRTAKRELPARRNPPGRSIGSPTDGHLVGGAHLNESPYLRIVPFYAPGDARWGLEPLVSMIDNAARAVRKQFPDAVLSVGHLSRPGGGEIDRHASHESGRDADIGFYVKNHKGKPIYADHFVPFRGDGTAATWPGAQFDDARNWALVASIAGNAQARVTYIFIASPLRARLLQYAAKIGAPAAIRARAAELMAQPRGSLPHD